MSDDKIVKYDGAEADATATFGHRLAPLGAVVTATTTDDPLARAPGTDLRVVSWNTRYGDDIKTPIAQIEGPFIPVDRLIHTGGVEACRARA